MVCLGPAVARAGPKNRAKMAPVGAHSVKRHPREHPEPSQRTNEPVGHFLIWTKPNAIDFQSLG